MGKLKKESGITLIALVVTIIVLLILAGVSISMLTGENGILKRANEAKEETQRATEDEQRKMAMYEAAMNTELTYFQGVPIPAGFAPTRMPGESTIDEGLVITDSQGNEFVWIPCEYDKASAKEAKENGEKISESPIYYNDTDIENKNGKCDNRNDSWKQSQWMYNGGTWYDSQPHSENVEDSIKTHHGFYVARYEAGVPEAADFYVSPTSTDLTYNTKKDETAKVDNLAPVSKKGNQAWNYISQKNAKIVAGYMVNNSNVKSYLIDSHAWNTICRLIETKYSKEKVTDSKKWGNYKDNTTTKYQKVKGLWAKHIFISGSTWNSSENYNFSYLPEKTKATEDKTGHIEMATGICEDFKAYNIYDMAGNMWEWTTETGTNPGSNQPNGDTTCNEGNCPTPAEYAVLRGGGFNSSGAGDLVVSASGSVKGEICNPQIGFRVVLYIE